MVETFFISVPVFKIHVVEHASIKDKILKFINNENGKPIHSIYDKISFTDWNKDSKRNIEYWNFCQPTLSPYITKIIAKIGNGYSFATSLEIINVWYQQYKSKDFHGWHIHSKSTWSFVYFVELPKNSPSTLLRAMDGSEISTNAVEGDLIAFPSYIEHCSPPNSSNEMKTVVAFNMLQLQKP